MSKYGCNGHTNMIWLATPLIHKANIYYNDIDKPAINYAYNYHF